MKTNKIEVNEVEKTLITTGLGKLAKEAQSLCDDASRMGVFKAAKEASSFKETIVGLSERIMGVKKLPLSSKKSGKNLDAK